MCSGLAHVEMCVQCVVVVVADDSACTVLATTDGFFSFLLHKIQTKQRCVTVPLTPFYRTFHVLVLELPRVL
jgi:hypothetical protein